MKKSMIYLAAGLLCVSKGVSASEGLIEVAPVGGNDFLAGVLPQTGWYGGAAFVAIPGKDYYDSNGDKVPLEFDYEPYFLGIGAMYVYPGEVAGGRLASSVQLSAVKSRATLAGNEVTANGLADAYVDVLMWSRSFGAPAVSGNPKTMMQSNPNNISPWQLLPQGLSVLGGLAMKVPIGKYDSDKPLNPGTNVWVVSPNVGVTYLSEPHLFDAPFELSTRVYYSIPRRNSDNDYRTGRMLTGDWAISQYIGPAQVGLQGSFVKQLTDDDPGPDYMAPVINGNRAEFASAGPIVGVMLPGGWSVKLKAGFQFHREGGVKTDLYALSISRPLF